MLRRNSAGGGGTGGGLDSGRDDPYDACCFEMTGGSLAKIPRRTDMKSRIVDFFKQLDVSMVCFSRIHTSRPTQAL